MSHTKIFKKIICLSVAMIMFSAAAEVIFIPEAFAAPRDVLVKKINFDRDLYRIGEPLIGQPEADGEDKWFTSNVTAKDSVIHEPVAPFDAVESGLVAGLKWTHGNTNPDGSTTTGQIRFPFASQTVDIRIDGRMYLTGQPASVLFNLYSGGNFLTQFAMQNGGLRHSDAGGMVNTGANTMSSFASNSSYTVPSGGRWIRFSVKVLRSEDDSLFDRAEFYIGYDNAPLQKLETVAGKETLRNKNSAISGLGFQIGATQETAYLDYLHVYQTDVKDRLQAPERPTWDQTKLSWKSVTGAESYQINLSRNGKLVATIPDPSAVPAQAPITETSLELGSIMNEIGFGVYTATVTAIADPAMDLNSFESVPTAILDFANTHPQLAKPNIPVWAGNTLTWNAVSGAAGYAIDLYKGVVRVKSVTMPVQNVICTCDSEEESQESCKCWMESCTVSAELCKCVNIERSFNFESELITKGKGPYKARIKAIADQKVNRDSDITEFSEINNFDPASGTIAPTDENFCRVAAASVAESVLSNQGRNGVTENLNLPSAASNGVTIRWESDNPSVINIVEAAAARSGAAGYVGVVNRPSFGKDALVTLTATFQKNAHQYKQMYKFIVKSLNPGPSTESPRSGIVYHDSGLSESTFSDMDSSHWAMYYVDYLYSAGIVSGTPDGRFEPDRYITREEVCKILVNILGLSGNAQSFDFNDVKGHHWFYNNVESAFASGIVNGISETEFGAGRNISRQDLAVMIARAVNYAKIELPAENEKVIFDDEESIADYAKESIEALQMAGILSGSGDGTINPHGAATRAEAAKLICVVYLLVR